MDETERDVQRWFQLLFDKKLTLLEFFVLSRNAGLTHDAVLKSVVGMTTTRRIPALRPEVRPMRRFLFPLGGGIVSGFATSMSTHSSPVAILQGCMLGLGVMLMILGAQNRE